jgi:hypothetical protein
MAEYPKNLPGWFQMVWKYCSTVVKVSDFRVPTAGGVMINEKKKTKATKTAKIPTTKTGRPNIIENRSSPTAGILPINPTIAPQITTNNKRKNRVKGENRTAETLPLIKRRDSLNE